MSSDIKSRLCTFCTQSNGIDTPSQKTHEDNICEVDIRLDVEEVRAYQFMMAWGMVFGMVVAKVGASGPPVNLELYLVGTIPDPVEIHVDCL